MHGTNSRSLRPLPVAALRLSENTLDLLGQLGIRRIEQLEALPRRELDSRFGRELLWRWDQATGRVAEPVPGHHPPPEFQARQVLEYPTARREVLEQVLEKLLSCLGAELLRAWPKGLRLECRFGDGSFRVGLFAPTASARHLFSLARMQLERQSLASPVSAVQVQATLTAHWSGVSNRFSASARAMLPRELAALIDRLSSRIGAEGVVRPRLLADAQPELACTWDVLVGGMPSRRTKGGMPSHGEAVGRHVHDREKHADPMLRIVTACHPSRIAPACRPPRELCHRPLRLIARPVGLVAVSVVPDGPLLRFRWRGCLYQAAWSCGPERIETGWWRGQPVGRDYYRMETTAGQRFWVFRRLRDGRWFLHGTFE